MFSMVVLSRHLSESSKGFDSPNTSSPAETKEIQECAIHLLNFKVSNSPKHQLNFKVPNFRQILAKLGEIMIVNVQRERRDGEREEKGEKVRRKRLNNIYKDNLIILLNLKIYF